MKKASVVVGVYCLATVAFAALAWADINPYLEARRAHTAVLLAQYSSKDLETEVERLADCLAPSPEQRSCLMDAMSKSNTMEGALIGATASKIILQRGQDQELQSAALDLINRGRVQLGSSKPIWDSLKNLNSMHDKSVLLSLRDGKRNTRDWFEWNAERLDKAEYEVMLPQVSLEQRRWLTNQYANAAAATTD